MKRILGYYFILLFSIQCGEKEKSKTPHSDREKDIASNQQETESSNKGVGSGECSYIGNIEGFRVTCKKTCSKVSTLIDGGKFVGKTITITSNGLELKLGVVSPNEVEGKSGLDPFVFDILHEDGEKTTMTITRDGEALPLDELVRLTTKNEKKEEKKPDSVIEKDKDPKLVQQDGVDLVLDTFQYYNNEYVRTYPEIKVSLSKRHAEDPSLSGKLVITQLIPNIQDFSIEYTWKYKYFGKLRLEQKASIDHDDRAFPFEVHPMGDIQEITYSIKLKMPTEDSPSREVVYRFKVKKS